MLQRRGQLSVVGKRAHETAMGRLEERIDGECATVDGFRLCVVVGRLGRSSYFERSLHELLLQANALDKDPMIGNFERQNRYKMLNGGSTLHGVSACHRSMKRPGIAPPRMFHIERNLLGISEDGRGVQCPAQAIEGIAEIAATPLGGCIGP
jgi:hypothetical protein